MTTTHHQEQTMTSALAVSTPFAPTGIEQAEKLALTLSKSTLLPEPLRGKPADVLVTLITGHELGLSPMQALRGMHVINGKAVMSADLMIALVLKHRDVCAFFRLVESTDAVATYQTQRQGSEPVSLSWTVEQARKAGLADKGTWKAHPAAMLRARCSSALARAVYPDLVLGVYDPDEAAEFTPPARAARQVPAASPEPTIDAPAPEAPPSAVEALMSRVDACTSRGQLLTLIPEIKQLAEDQRDRVRAAYKARQDALAEGAR